MTLQRENAIIAVGWLKEMNLVENIENYMKPEEIVVEAVRSYFLQTKFQRFSIKREDQIQFGSRFGFADIVLFDNRNKRSAIVECKRDGIEGNGIEQLKSYLSATDTPLGIFANSREPNSWKFYKNLGQNRLKEISRIEFERQLFNPIVRVLNFFRRVFHRPSKGGYTMEPTVPSHNSLLTKPDEKPIASPKQPIYYTGRYEPLQNEYRDNAVDPTLDGKPYYSEQNGFYWAANHQGIAECVPQHIKRIIHHEELEIAATREELEEEIKRLYEEKVDLEKQKSECDQEIIQRTQELAKKKEDFAGLEVQLQALTLTRSGPFPVEAESDNSNSELLNVPNVDDIPNYPVIKGFEEEIDDLNQKKVDLEQAIEEKSQDLAGKKEESAGLEAELQGPTETELNSIVAGTATDNAPPAKLRVSGINRITAIISSVVLGFLAIYLIFFYASAADKAFFLNTEAIQEQLAQGTYAGINDVVNPSALFKAFQGGWHKWNPVVVMLPFVFLAFAIALDYFWEQGKWWFVLLLAALTLVFDTILAIQISQKIHQAKVLMDPDAGEWSVNSINPFTWDLNIWTVIFCGFVVSMLVSITYHVMNQRWKAISPPEERFEAEDMRESQIKSEKTQREARIAVLNVEMENLQNGIEQLKEKDKTTQQKIIKAVRTPIESQVAILKTEMENSQSELEQFHERAAAIQKRIDTIQTKIEELTSQRNRRVINRSKMESQVNQFLIGWCRFVAHSEDGTTDVSAQIEEIEQVAQDTLEQYYQGSPDYFPQS